MNLNKGFILVDMSLCILITLIIVSIVFSVKLLETKNIESLEAYIEENDRKYIQIISKRSECEIECETDEEEVLPLNS